MPSDDDRDQPLLARIHHGNAKQDHIADSSSASRSLALPFPALKLGAAARAVPVNKLAIVPCHGVRIAFLGERLSAVNWLGIVLIGCGALLVANKG